LGYAPHAVPTLHAYTNLLLIGAMLGLATGALLPIPRPRLASIPAGLLLAAFPLVWSASEANLAVGLALALSLTAAAFVPFGTLLGDGTDGLRADGAVAALLAGAAIAAGVGLAFERSRPTPSDAGDPTRCKPACAPLSRMSGTRDVLLLGVGDGGYLAAALASAATSVRVVVTGPAALARARAHPGRPLDDPRVEVRYDDPRAS